MKNLFLGVDPGKSGAMALVGPDGEHVSTVKLKETPRDVWDWLEGFTESISYAVIEKVNAMPRQGVSSSFKFGENFGFCQGLLTASGVRFELVRPQRWQRAQACLTKGDKNVTKNRAQQLWPDVKITHALADALLIADFARKNRQEGGLADPKACQAIPKETANV